MELICKTCNAKIEPLAVHISKGPDGWESLCPICKKSHPIDIPEAGKYIMAFAVDELFNGQEWTRTYDNFSDSYDFSIPVKSIYFFDTPEALLCKWHEIDDNPNGPEGMWYWVCETGDDGSPCTVCSGAFDPDDIDEIFVELMWR